MMKVRKSGFLRTILLVITNMSLCFPAYAKYGGGAGEPNDPYKIATAADLMLLGESPEDYDKHFIMIDDIDLDPNLPGRKVFDGAVIAPDTNGVESDFQNTSFNGVFDGNGHIISHLTIKGESYLGLFGHIDSGAIISNLDLEAVDVNGTGDFIGGLVGDNAGLITSSYSTGTVNGDWRVGGLVGYNSFGNISNCYSTGAVTGGSYVGGLMGGNSGRLSNCSATGNVLGDGIVGGLVGSNEGFTKEIFLIDNCCATGRVEGHHYVGGLVGLNDSTISDSSATGDVTATRTSYRVTYAGAGGLVGFNGGGTIRRCYSAVSIVGHENVGGLVGMNINYWGLIGTIIDCYSAGCVTGTDNVGGLVGFNHRYTSIASSYSTSTVDGNSYIGGLVGMNDEGSVTSCFWDTQTSGQTESDGGFGKTTTEMQMTSTFLWAGWDFVGEVINGTEDIWWIDEGNDYPRLWWEPSSSEWPTDDLFFLVVDDFESYRDISEGLDRNRIYHIWIDGWWYDPNNGSQVGYLDPPFHETTIVHSGRQSMPYFYDNSEPANYSEATMTLTSLRDWTIEGVGVLSLWFYGDPNNAAEPMYVALNKSAVVYHDNPEALLIEDWMEWRIDLQEFADQGVNLTNIYWITIGFGDKNNPQPGSSGLVFFDDIRLYRPDSQEQTP